MDGQLKIGVTGASGMLGWHLRCRLHQYPNVEIATADRSTFADRELLENFVSGQDAIVHLAGQNRGDEAEIAATNPGLAEQLVAALTATGSRAHVLFSSSVHSEGDTTYGKSKRQADEIFRNWSKANSTPYTCFVIPHVFGEGTKPYYNSAVATFAYQIAVGEAPRLEHDGDVELIHAQAVCALIFDEIRNKKLGRIRIKGIREKISVSLDRLLSLAGQYSDDNIPDVRERLNLQMFNFYRSYLFHEWYPRKLIMNSDERGYLVEAVKSGNGGQMFYSTTEPGVTRGNHFHLEKIERFLVIEGEARINVRKMFSNKVFSFDVTGENPAYVDMPTLHTHNIVNTGSSKLVTMFWAHEVFDPDRPDTFFEMV